MTIKICHNKFRKTSDLIVRIVAKFTVYLFLAWFVVSCVKVFHYHEFEGLWGIGLIFGGVMGISLWTWVPWVFDQPNDLSLLNRKLKLFEWREDC